jgi:hypothetical protein
MAHSPDKRAQTRRRGRGTKNNFRGWQLQQAGVGVGCGPFAIGIVGLAILYLTRLTRPGGEQKISAFLIIAPFLVIVILLQSASGRPPVRIGTG